MDQKLKGYARNAENKRRLDNNQRDNRRQQPPPFKRQHVGGQNVTRAYVVRNNERKGYVGPLPYYNKCRFHHDGPCTVKCGLQLGIRWVLLATNTVNNGAKARAYALRGGGTNLDSNIVTSTFLLNNRYASMLFNSGTVRSFVSNAFSTLLHVALSTLDTNYDVELVDGRISETNIILRGYTLGLLGHQFDIDLIPVELGSFDFIIGMDWMAKYHALIICDEKIICIPSGDKVLIIQDDVYNRESKLKLSIISYTKIQKYIKKECQVFLAQVTKKKTKEKSEEKRLKDVPIV
ncbi:reverse transcriptase domain-containing protein [Tanacetum coccineum]